MSIADREFAAIIDTGASNNFIHPSLIPPNILSERKIPPASLASADSALELIGSITINVDIQDRDHSITFLVAPRLVVPMLLGYPWLREQNSIIDVTQNVVFLGKQDRSIIPIMAADCKPRSQVKIDFEKVQHGFPTGCQDKFALLIDKFANVFDSPKVMNQTCSIKHEITLTEEKVINVTPYRYSKKKNQAIQEQVREMLEAGVIEPACSPFNSPIVVATKKTGEPRFCVDFRDLNLISKGPAQQLPHMQDLLKDIGTAKVFSTLDLRSGYWQIRMDSRSKKYTAFTTPDGHTYQFRGMPFGLRFAPMTFQRLMSQKVLTGYLGVFCFCYLDDIIVFSNSWEEHLQHLQMIFERLLLHGLVANLDKCVFGKTEIKFLGQMVKEQVNEALPESISAILNAPIPKTKKQLQSFIGTCNWLSEYVPHYSHITAPLTDLIGNTRFIWTDETNNAFLATKELFRQPLSLHRPDPNEPFILQTDASKLGMGAVLFQYGPEKQRRIVSFASAKFKPVEQRYHCNEQECLAVVWAVKKYRRYLEDQRFTLLTDSRAVTWLSKFKDSRTKLTRWSLLLQEFDFIIEHCPGKENELPDALSRDPIEDNHDDFENFDRLFPPDTTSALLLVPTQDIYEEVLYQQQLCPQVSQLVEKIQAASQRQSPNRLEKNLLESYLLRDGTLYRKHNEKWLAFVPSASRERVLWEYHDSKYAGHPGADETYNAISRIFNWKGLSSDVKNYVRTCHICTCIKPGKNPSDVPQRPHQPTKPWQTIALDLMGPYPRSPRGKRFLLVVTDMFSRWVEAFPLGNSETHTILATLEEQIFPRWGFPRSILSDNAPQFSGTKWRDRLESLGIECWTTAIYHPQANPTERRNQEIKKAFRVDLFDKGHQNWEKSVPQILFNLRCRKNAATGKTPSETLFGETLLRPGEWKIDRPQSESQQEIAQHQRQYHAQRYPLLNLPLPESESLQEGDLVYVRQHPQSKAAAKFHAGFAIKWDGPFVIDKKISDSIYLINNQKIHRRDIKPKPKTEDRRADGEVEIEISQEESEIEPRYNLRNKKK